MSHPIFLLQQLARWLSPSLHARLKALGQWLRGFAPGAVRIDRMERMRACSGALFGILLTGLVSHLTLGDSPALPWLIAPMGASAVLLFAVPSSPLAQPWSIIGGNLVSALIGVTCARLIGAPLLAAAVAIALAIGTMMLLRCIHPPSGAVALTAVLGGPTIHAMGYDFMLAPVGLNSVLLLLTALVFNNATKRPYPHRPLEHSSPHHTRDTPTGRRLSFTHDDLDAVLQQYNQLLDVSRDDLEVLLEQTEMHAYRRRFGEITCADIMSRDVITVEYGTALQDAWAMLHHHGVKALPVIDRARRVIGMLTQADFIQHANVQAYQDFSDGLRHFLRRSGLVHSEKAEVVGQIMHASAHAVAQDTHIVALVPLLLDTGRHHVPVMDAERRLCGIITQSDLVAALYRGKLAE